MKFIKNKRILKIIIIFIVLILAYLVIEKSFGKYHYTESFEALSLYRNLELPTAEISYSTTEPTNNDVILTLALNKEIVGVPEGMKWDADKKTLTKVITENENSSVTVKDLSGNENTFEYKVDWIDRENPKIVGAEDGNTYSSPLVLNYTDNMGIKSVEAEYLGFLSVADNRIGYVGETFNLIDFSDTTYTARVKDTPKDAVKYRYYLGNELKAETSNLSYTFKNLAKNQYEFNYTIEALNNEGSVIDSVTSAGTTTTYRNISVERNQAGATIKLSGISSELKSVEYYVWLVNNSSERKRYTTNIENNSATLSFNISSFNNEKGIYAVHIYTRDSNRNKSNVVGYDIEIGSGYMFPQTATDFSKVIVNPYNLTKKGRYRIKAIDLANNFLEYFIRVK